MHSHTGDCTLDLLCQITANQTVTICYYNANKVTWPFNSAFPFYKKKTEKKTFKMFNSSYLLLSYTEIQNKVENTSTFKLMTPTLGGWTDFEEMKRGPQKLKPGVLKLVILYQETSLTNYKNILSSFSWMSNICIYFPNNQEKIHKVHVVA